MYSIVCIVQSCLHGPPPPPKKRKQKKETERHTIAPAPALRNIMGKRNFGGAAGADIVVVVVGKRDWEYIQTMAEMGREMRDPAWRPRREECR